MQDASVGEIFDEFLALEPNIRDLPELGITFKGVDEANIRLEFFELLCSSQIIVDRIQESIAKFPISPKIWNYRTIDLLDILGPECLNITLTDSAHPLDKISPRPGSDIGLTIAHDNDVPEAQDAFESLMMAWRETGDTMVSFFMTLRHRGNGFEAWLELLQLYSDVLGPNIALEVIIDDEGDDINMNPEDLLSEIGDTVNQYCERYALDLDDRSRPIFELFMKKE